MIIGTMVQPSLVTCPPCVVDGLSAVTANAYTIGRLHSFAVCQFLADDTAVSVHEPDFILVHFVVTPFDKTDCFRKIEFRLSSVY